MEIILYEPEEEVGKAIKSGLERLEYKVKWDRDIHSARNDIELEKFNISLVDIDGGRHNHQMGYGLDLIEKFLRTSKRALCISIFRKQNTENGFKASHLGSQEIYEITSGNITGLAHIINNYEIRIAMPQLFEHTNPDFIKCINDLRALINHNKPVLISGESGSGKSYLAEHVLNESTNQNFSYEEIRCGDIKGEDIMEQFLGIARGSRPEIKSTRKGILERANNKGLLYLEQIQDLAPELQEILANVLETGKFRRCGSLDSIDFTAHIIASCDSVSQLENGNFNKKLFMLISPNLISVPPLRDSLPDIIPTVEQIIEDFCIKNRVRQIPKLSSEAMIKLYSHSWPGNYRELVSCVETAAAKSANGIISENEISITPTVEEGPLPTNKCELIRFWLRRHHGKKSAVAIDLKISRPTLDDWLDECGINYKQYKPTRKTTRKKP